ncbi:MAG: DUF523 domain-containing protein [Limosilactobacillus sp.]
MVTVILISACLAGFNVRYDGGNARRELAVKLVALGKAITVCPEIMAGFVTPRIPAEIQGGDGNDVLAGRARVVTKNGRDVTQQYVNAARQVFRIAQAHDVQVAFLKQKSPACGTQLVYDGHFSGHKIAGMGVTAALLAQNNIQVDGDEELTLSHLKPYLDTATLNLLQTRNVTSGV